MDARKHRCRIFLGASEPVAYRLVIIIIIIIIIQFVSSQTLNAVPRLVTVRDHSCCLPLCWQHWQLDSYLAVYVVKEASCSVKT